MFALALLVVGGALVWGLSMSPERTHRGRPYVIDGDSLAFGRRRVRLIGIDAPELKQQCRRKSTDWPCGNDARAFLHDLVLRKDVVCTVLGADVYRRDLASCQVGQININKAVVAAGWAVADGAFGRAEAGARAAGKGIWAGTFDQPKVWRDRNGS